MQRQCQQFVEFFVPPVQFLDLMVDIPAACRSWYAQCTLRSRPLRSNRYNSGNCFGRACYCATTGALVGVAQWLVRRWIHVMHHPGWLLEEFTIFFLRGLSSIHVLLFSLQLPAHRRQWQWHFPYWFCWYWRTSRCVPMIAGSLQSSAQSMLWLLTRCTWKSEHIFSEPPVSFSMFSVRIFARVDFLAPSSTHTCECSRAGGVPELGSPR